MFFCISVGHLPKSHAAIIPYSEVPLPRNRHLHFNARNLDAQETEWRKSRMIGRILLSVGLFGSVF